jgi:hypothetical protein
MQNGNHQALLILTHKKTPTRTKNLAFQDKIVEVLVDRIEQGMVYGNTNEMKLARFPSKDESLKGSLIKMKVTAPRAWVLEVVRAGAAHVVLGRLDAVQDGLLDREQDTVVDLDRNLAGRVRYRRTCREACRGSEREDSD